MDLVQKKSTVNSKSQRSQRSKSFPSCEERENKKISTSINVSAAFTFSNTSINASAAFDTSHHVQQAFAYSKKKKSSPSCAAFAFSNTLLLAGEKAVSYGVSHVQLKIDELFCKGIASEDSIRAWRLRSEKSRTSSRCTYRRRSPLGG